MNVKTRQHDPFVFPRKQEADLLAGMLRSSRLTLLFGDEGAGKTMLLHHDLLPQLRRRSIDRVDAPPREGGTVIPFPDRRRRGSGAAAPGEVVVFFDRWSGSPLEDLHAATRDALGPRGEVLGCFDSASLSSASRTLGVRFLFVLDAFEQLLAAPPGRREAKAFADEFVIVLNHPGLAANFLLSLRDDARADLERFRGRIVGLDRHWLRLQPIPPDVRPAASAPSSTEAPLRAESPRRPSLTAVPQAPLVAPLDDTPMPSAKPSNDAWTAAAGTSVEDAGFTRGDERAAPITGAALPVRVAAAMAAIDQLRNTAKPSPQAPAEARRTVTSLPASTPEESDGTSAHPEAVAAEELRASPASAPDAPEEALPLEAPKRAEAPVRMPDRDDAQPLLAETPSNADSPAMSDPAYASPAVLEATVREEAAPEPISPPTIVETPEALEEPLQVESPVESGQSSQEVPGEMSERSTPAPSVATPQVPAAPPMAAETAAAADEAAAMAVAERFEGAAEDVRSSPPAVEVPTFPVLPANDSKAERGESDEAPSGEPPAPAPWTPPTDAPLATDADADADADAEHAILPVPAALREPLAEPGASADAWVRSASGGRSARRTSALPWVAGVVMLVGVGGWWLARSPDDRAPPVPAESSRIAAATATPPPPAVPTPTPTPTPAPALAGADAPKTTSPVAAAPVAATPPPANDLPMTPPPGPATIAADHENSSDQRIAADLARRLAPVLAEPGAQPLRIVHYDALQAAHQSVVAPTFTVLMPLFREEIRVFARDDSPLESIADIRGKTVNIGPAEGARAITAGNLYRQMFGMPMAPAQANRLDRDAALLALRDGSIDAMVVVDAVPSGWIDGLSSSDAGGIRALPFDRGDKAARNALREYLPATLPATPKPTPTVAVMSFLVTDAPASAATQAWYGDFARALCEQLPALRRESHSKWRDLQPGLEVDTGWPVSATVRDALRACGGAGAPVAAATTTAAAAPPVPAASPKSNVPASVHNTPRRPR